MTPTPPDLILNHSIQNSNYVHEQTVFHLFGVSQASVVTVPQAPSLDILIKRIQNGALNVESSTQTTYQGGCKAQVIPHISANAAFWRAGQSFHPLTAPAPIHPFDCFSLTVEWGKLRRVHTGDTVRHSLLCSHYNAEPGSFTPLVSGCSRQLLSSKSGKASNCFQTPQQSLMLGQSQMINK